MCSTLATRPEIERAPALSAAAPRCVVRPLTIGQLRQWDEYVHRHEHGTFFHTLAWRDAVRHAFRHEDVYLVATRSDAITGVLPLFVVRSWIAGRMLVSVPYGVGGGILADDDESAMALFNAAREIAHTRHCRSIDLRSEHAAVPGLSTVEHYVGFERELPADPDDVLSWLPRKARAAARNARYKYELRSAFGDQHLHDVWRLYARNMQRLASLTYPFTFFKRLIELTPGRHWVSVVQWEGRTVAGLVTFLFRDRVMPYFLGAAPQARRCSASNFIYLTAMERGAAEGYRVFDFGRSRRDNGGSFQFKVLNGFEPRPLHYQVYTPPGHRAPDLSPTSPRYRLARRVWTHLPAVLARGLGSRVARHIPG